MIIYYDKQGPTCLVLQESCEDAEVEVDGEQGPGAPQAWQEAYYTLSLFFKVAQHCPREVGLTLPPHPPSPRASSLKIWPGPRNPYSSFMYTEHVFPSSCRTVLVCSRFVLLNYTRKD